MTQKNVFYRWCFHSVNRKTCLREKKRKETICSRYCFLLNLSWIGPSKLAIAQLQLYLLSSEVLTSKTLHGVQSNKSIMIPTKTKSCTPIPHALVYIWAAMRVFWKVALWDVGRWLCKQDPSSKHTQEARTPIVRSKNSLIM